MLVANQVQLKSPIDGAYRTEIERRIFFISADIAEFSLVEGDGRISGIVFSADETVDAAALGIKIVDVIESDVAGRGLPTAGVVWDSGSRTAAHPDVYQLLVSDGLVSEAGEGQVALGGDLLALMDFLDEAVTRIVLDGYAGEEFRYPTLIPTEVLDRIGYFASFPQFLMFVTRLHGDADTYRSVAASSERGQPVDSGLLASCDNLDYCLPPTMCFHTFHQNAGRTLTGNRTVTAKGKSFRFESRYARSLERLWDFTIREIVFLGERDHVLACRERFMADVFALFERLGVTGYCEVANDPFFCNDDTSGKVLSQRLLRLKYELRADIAAERTIAVASFNYHDTFFSERMDIRDADSKWVSTACAGIGLERLVYAFLCQHGSDPAGWPDLVRASLNRTDG